MRINGNNFQHLNLARNGTHAEFKPSGNQALDQWANAINRASKISGLDPNLIGGQIWAESRGDPNAGSTNVDGNKDLGLTQISQERWQNEILPNLTPDQRAAIVQETGKQPEDLDMNIPEENVIGGTLELAQKIKDKGSVEAGLEYYVSGGNPSLKGTYVEDVLNFQNILASGGQLPP